MRGQEEAAGRGCFPNTLSMEGKGGGGRTVWGEGFFGESPWNAL